MTTYILAGGCDRKYPEYVAQLGRVVHYKVARPRILSCGFAEDDERAEEKFPEYRDLFAKSFGEHESFIKAEKAQLVEQIREADVVYLPGGETDALLQAMRQYPGIEREFEGKIVVGSSAGAHYLASYGYIPDERRLDVCGGLLDVAVVVHYGSPGYSGTTIDPTVWDEAVRKVREASGRDEITLLPEGTFTVIER